VIVKLNGIILPKADRAQIERATGFSIQSEVAATGAWKSSDSFVFRHPVSLPVRYACMVPFWYHLPVPALEQGEIGQDSTVRLVRWLVCEGTSVHEGTVVAIIATDSDVYEVLTNGDGSLREKMFPEGATIPSASPLATISADGENIPYSRPCSIARRITALPSQPKDRSCGSA